MNIEDIYDIDGVDPSIIQQIKDLRPIDDYFMKELFSGDVELTQLLLDAIIDVKLTVKSVKTQKLMPNLAGRSLQLDVLAHDTDGRIYNIEIQRDDKGADARRARYHSSMLDAYFMKKGKSSYDELPETYVIFITEHDVFKKSRPLYKFDRRDEEDGSLFGDKSHIIYVNGENRDDTPLGRLMHDFACSDPRDMMCEMLADKVTGFKETEKGVKRMSSVLREAFENGMNKGINKGKIEGKIEGMFNTLFGLVKDGIVQMKVAAERTDLSEDEFKAKMDEYFASSH